MFPSRLSLPLRPCLLFCVLLYPAVGSADSHSTSRRGFLDLEDASVPNSRSFSSRFGVAALEQALGSAEQDTRLRAIQRLGAMATTAARTRLVELAKNDSPLSDRELIALVGALAKHSGAPSAISGLILIASGAAAQGSSGRPSARAAFAREQACLALAASHNAKALAHLSRMLERPGEAGDMAHRALRAHPLQEISKLFELGPSLPRIALLAYYRTPEVRQILRKWARTAGLQERLEAGIALAQHGDPDTVPLARYWLKLTPAAPPSVLRAATEILLIMRAPEAGAAWHQFAKERRRAALTLALEYPQASLAEPLVALFNPKDDQVYQWLEALGHCSGSAAVPLLAELLAARELSSSAAVALAYNRSRATAPMLDRLLKPGLNTAQTSAAVFSATLRYALYQVESSGLASKLASFAKSPHAHRRWLSALGYSLQDEKKALQLLLSTKQEERAAAAATALRHGPWFFRGAARALARGAKSSKSQHLRVALLAPAGRDLISSRQLRLWLSAGSVWAPLALRALAERDAPEQRELTKRHLKSSDSMYRGAAALGLSRSRAAFALSAQMRALPYETNANVRRIILSSIGKYSRVNSSAAIRTMLKWATLLDPATENRALAHALLRGKVARPSVSHQRLLSVEVPNGPLPPALNLLLGDVHSVPLLSGAGRQFIGFGLPPGPASIRLGNGPYDSTR